MERIECSVWNNGGAGWGLKILGGPRVRSAHFNRSLSPVLVELDGVFFPCNIDKNSFWTDSCGELISVHLKKWIKQKGFTHSEHVWLEILEPYRKSRAVQNKATVPEAA